MLDVIESLYTKDLVMVTPYDQDGDQEPVLATVYVFDKDQIARDPQMYEPLCLPSDKTMFDRFVSQAPGARYMEILQEGARLFSLDPEYIRTQLGRASS